MSKKSESAKKRNQITVNAKADEEDAVVVARTVTRPTVLAAVSLKEYGESYGDLDVAGLVECLTEQTSAVKDGDLTRGEAMLTAQAHTLDAIFNKLAVRAINSQYMDHLDSYLKLALRAQSQCRATWEAVSAIKNPPVMGYVKQANIANGPQQVNNASTEAPRARGKQNPQNQLSEDSHELLPDKSHEGSAIALDTPSETMGEVHRAKDTAGKA